MSIEQFAAHADAVEGKHASIGGRQALAAVECGAGNRTWEVVQVLDTITPGNPHYSEKSRLAKTIQKDGSHLGNDAERGRAGARATGAMTCYSCHSSWTTSCFGCHLPMIANQRDAHAP